TTKEHMPQEKQLEESVSGPELTLKDLALKGWGEAKAKIKNFAVVSFSRTFVENYQNAPGGPLSPGRTCCHQVPKHLCRAAVANLVRSWNCHYASRGVGRIALRG
ncbi:hypothetical protein PIB30_093847, partial [Stylosanthes scabra]|nr:hypothetical protein [Stylosanthes scabra]